MYTFPSWTSLVVNDYESRDTYISNADQFSEQLECGKVHSVPDFLMHYMEKIEHLVDYGKSSKPGSTRQIIKEISGNPSVHSSLNFQENWMNKNSEESSQQERNLSYTDISFYKNRSEGPSQQESNVDFTYISFDKNRSETISILNPGTLEHSTPCKENIKCESKENNKAQSKHDFQLKWKRNKKTLKNNRERVYIRLYTVLNVIHNQAMERKNCPKPLIIKSGINATKKIGAKLHKLKDTSILDSLIEIISFNWRTIKSFQLYCNELECTLSNNCIFKVAAKYSESGKKETISKLRWDIFSEHCLVIESDTCNAIKSNENQMGPFIERIWKHHFDDHYSLKKYYSCRCNNEAYNLLTTIKLEHLSVSGLSTLHKEIERYPRRN